MMNLLDPAILFFVFGVLAGTIKSNLEIPRSVVKFLSLYLLMALGLKGGFALAATGLNSQIFLTLAVALAMSFLVPAIGYWVLRRLTTKFNAAAVAAAYGSTSAVTFVTATQYLNSLGIDVGGHMSVALVLMESPAIIMAVLLANYIRQSEGSAVSSKTSFRYILHESFTDGAHLLLLGSLLIGYLSGDAGKKIMEPFSVDIFKGMLAFFLLDMGLMVAANFKQAVQNSPMVLSYGIFGPILHASLALGFGYFLQLPVSDTIMLMVLSASASYIVVPAVLRYAIPEANPAIYFGLSIGITFPINIMIGIPIYTWAARSLLG